MRERQGQREREREKERERERVNEKERGREGERNLLPSLMTRVRINTHMQRRRRQLGPTICYILNA